MYLRCRFTGFVMISCDAAAADLFEVRYLRDLGEKYSCSLLSNASRWQAAACDARWGDAPSRAGRSGVTGTEAVIPC